MFATKGVGVSRLTLKNKLKYSLPEVARVGDSTRDSHTNTEHGTFQDSCSLAPWSWEQVWDSGTSRDPRGWERAGPEEGARATRTGGAVAQEPSATPARARLRAHAHGARDPLAVSPTSTGFSFSLFPFRSIQGLGLGERDARARGLAGSTRHANEGRGGARPAAARSRVPGRATRGGAIVRWLLTHVPGFLSGEGGGGRGSGGGAGAGSGRRRWPP